MPRTVYMQQIEKNQKCISYEETNRKASNREWKLLQTNLRIEYKKGMRALKLTLKNKILII